MAELEKGDHGGRLQSRPNPCPHRHPLLPRGSTGPGSARVPRHRGWHAARSTPRSGRVETQSVSMSARGSPVGFRSAMKNEPSASC